MSDTRRATRPRGARAKFSVTAIAAIALLASACGSGEDGGSEGSNTGDKSVAADSVAAAKERLASWYEEPTELTFDTPLSAEPAAGKTIANVQVDAPSGEGLIAPLEEAADALGWKTVAIRFTLGNIEAENAAIQQAVDQGVDYIFQCGSDPTTIGPAAEAAHDAGIPIISCATSAVADPENSAIYSNYASPEWINKAHVALADWAIADGQGESNILFVSFPEVAPIKDAADAVKSQVPDSCPGCSVNVLDVSGADIGAGAIPGLVVSKLQQDPSIQYIQFGFGDLAIGVPDALEAAGMSDKKITTVQPAKAGLTYLADGAMDAVVVANLPAYAWGAVDLAARISVGDEVPPTVDPIDQLWDKTNMPEPMNTNPQFPADFKEQYKSLWGVS